MQSIQIYKYGPENALKIVEADSLIPGTNQACIDIQAIGVNPVDVYIRSGQYNLPLSFPHVLGFDAAGIIKSVGHNISRWKPGQRVFLAGSLTGTYAQEALCRPDQIYPLPDPITFEQGAALGIPYATAYRALFIKAKVKANVTCLIHGASGGVGTAAVQLAKMANLRIIATAGSPKGIKLVREMGADWIFDHCKANYLNEIMTITKGKGVDIILEMLSNVNLSHDLKTLANKGRIVIIGCRGPVTINPRELMTRDATIEGMLLKNASPAELREIYCSIVKGLDAGFLKPVIGRIFPLKDVKLAHRAILKSKAYGKIILKP